MHSVFSAQYTLIHTFHGQQKQEFWDQDAGGARAALGPLRG